MGNSAVRLGFFGDDFTGSTDALEALAIRGVDVVLFTAVPTSAELARHSQAQAIGIAGMTRALDPLNMERTLRPGLRALKAWGADIVHYKVCSTFDSSPEAGSIGRAIDIGRDIFDTQAVPIVASAPSLGRYCIFGNLFARCGAVAGVHRIDRHPSMSRHPITPMHEADLRIHLAKQTCARIGLVEITTVREGVQAMDHRFGEQRDAGAVVIDGLDMADVQTIGQFLRHRAEGRTIFVVGSSAVEEALASSCLPAGCQPHRAEAEPRQQGPLLVVAGSCSPVTAAQIVHGRQNGFSVISLSLESQDRTSDAIQQSCDALDQGQSVILRCAARWQPEPPPIGERIGRLLGDSANQIVRGSPVRRIVVAGGDTSGWVAGALGIERLTFVSSLARGAPWCKASGAKTPREIEVCFKGGQIGAEDFFVRALRDEGEP